MASLTRDRIGLGCAPLGNLFTAVSDADAEATVHAAWAGGVRLFDTAPLYGHGVSEARLGRALAGYERDSYTLASKVGRLLRPTAAADRRASAFRNTPAVDPVFDFSRDGVLSSIEESLTRLGTCRLDAVHVHDPDAHEAQALATAFPTLTELRDQGVIGMVGCGMNQTAMLERFVERVDLDCILLAGRYTLLDRSGEALLATCATRDVKVIIGGVFNSGLLARPGVGATFDYVAAPAALVRQARRLQRVCAQFGCELPAAAMQFVLRHPAVSSLLIGARSAAEITDDLGYTATTLDEQLWPALEAALTANG